MLSDTYKPFMMSVVAPYEDNDALGVKVSWTTVDIANISAIKNRSCKCSWRVVI